MVRISGPPLWSRMTLVIVFGLATVEAHFLKKTRVDRSIDQQQADNLSTRIPKQQTTFDDYDTRFVAYKDAELDICYLERMQENSLEKRNLWQEMLRRTPYQRTVYVSDQSLTKIEAWRLAGGRIVDFCRGRSMVLLREERPIPGTVEDPFFNEIPEDENDILQRRVSDVVLEPLRARAKRQMALEKRENLNSEIHVRKRRQAPFRGRFRGQTQSQYLNFGTNSSKEGKAEARVTHDSSYAVVSGANGMGQAQSMSAGGADCDECPGYRGGNLEISGRFVDKGRLGQNGAQPEGTVQSTIGGSGPSVWSYPAAKPPAVPSTGGQFPGRPPYSGGGIASGGQFPSGTPYSGGGTAAGDQFPSGPSYSGRGTAAGGGLPGQPPYSGGGTAVGGRLSGGPPYSGGGTAAGGQFPSGPPYSGGGTLPGGQFPTGLSYSGRGSAPGGQFSGGSPHSGGGTTPGGQFPSGSPYSGVGTGTGGQFPNGPPYSGGGTKPGGGLPGQPPYSGGGTTPGDQFPSGPPYSGIGTVAGGGLPGQPPYSGGGAAPGGQFPSGPPYSGGGTATGGQFPSGPPYSGGGTAGGGQFLSGPPYSGGGTVAGGQFPSGPPYSGGGTLAGGQFPSGPPYSGGGTGTGGQFPSGLPYSGGGAAPGGQFPSGPLHSGEGAAPGGLFPSGPPYLGGGAAPGGQFPSGPLHSGEGAAPGGLFPSGPPYLGGGAAPGGQFPGGSPYSGGGTAVGGQFPSRPPYSEGGTAHGGQFPSGSPYSGGGTAAGGQFPSGSPYSGGGTAAGGQFPSGSPYSGGGTAGGGQFPSGSPYSGGGTAGGGQFPSGPPYSEGGAAHGGQFPSGPPYSGGGTAAGGQFPSGSPYSGGGTAGGGQFPSGSPYSGGGTAGGGQFPSGPPYSGGGTATGGQFPSGLPYSGGGAAPGGQFPSGPPYSGGGTAGGGQFPSGPPYSGGGIAAGDQYSWNGIVPGSGRQPQNYFDPRSGRFVQPGSIEESGGGSDIGHPGSQGDGDDDADSQASSSVQKAQSGTTASASALGKFKQGTAQSQVSGTYSGSGSFSAQAGSNDDNKGAQTQVSGGKQGATSSAEGTGGRGKSQTQVQLHSDTGATSSGAQSSGWNHGTNSQVQTSSKGGMADAQANGEGSTSSQAQIGFQPYQKGNEQTQSNSSIFLGGGTASAQSGTYRGQSQAQLHGTFKYGLSYNGAAQAGSGSGAAASRKPFNLTNGDSELFKSFNQFEPVEITPDELTDEGSHQSTEEVPPETVTVPVPTEEVPQPVGEIAQSTEGQTEAFKGGPLIEQHNEENYGLQSSSSRQSTGFMRPSIGLATAVDAYEKNPQPSHSTTVYSQPDNVYEDPSLSTDDYDSFDEAEDSDYDVTPPPSSQVSQQGVSYDGDDLTATGRQRAQYQQINVPNIEYGAHVVQDSSLGYREGDILQPGHSLSGYTIPPGFRGKVSSVSGSDTLSEGDGDSQSQTVSLIPGSRNVTYENRAKESAASYTRSLQPSRSRYSYSSRKYTRPVPNKYLRTRPSPTTKPNYYTVTNSVAGQIDGNNKNAARKYEHRYYTKSSTCGYFTFSCDIVYGSNGRTKICKPKIPTHPDGSPIQC